MSAIDISRRYTVQPIFKPVVPPKFGPRPGKVFPRKRLVLPRVRHCATVVLRKITPNVRLSRETHRFDREFLREAGAALCAVVEAIDESEATGMFQDVEDVIRREAQVTIDWIVRSASYGGAEMATRVARRVREVASLYALAGHAGDADHDSRLRRLVACGCGPEHRGWPDDRAGRCIRRWLTDRSASLDDQPS